ncbi:hypothetical protein WMY93_029018 [Mugilogobius chulae]|uniref:Interleukin-1 receptor accessory protein n=1 Tax=Mugilogobius chulae TaxID=88201 RepID=A0AAW0MZ19_9GOBI
MNKTSTHQDSTQTVGPNQDMHLIHFAARGGGASTGIRSTPTSSVSHEHSELQPRVCATPAAAPRKRARVESLDRRGNTSNIWASPRCCLGSAHMTSCIRSLLALLLLLGSQTAVSQSNEPFEPMCYDWGESSAAAVHVLVGQSGFLSCPLFSHPSVYNYSSTQSAGHNLFWYRVLEGHEHDIEQPITNSARLSKDRDRLWLQPANANDTGQYICMLRNKTSCSKIAMRLTVLRPEDVTHSNSCAPAVAMPATHEIIPFQHGKSLDCPDADEAARMSNSTPTVSWVFLGRQSKRCLQFPTRSPERQVKGLSLQVHIMVEFYQGLYFCSVHYQRKGQALNFTRVINVTAVYPINLPKEPKILQPTKDYVFSIKQDEEARLICTALFPFLDSPWEIWWTIDGKTVEQLNDPRFSKTASKLKEDYGDRIEQSVLIIQDFQPEDLNREFNCSAKNDRGNETIRAQIKHEVSLPSLELGCGLGVTLFLMLVLFVVYHVFWLELLLLYRSWFGTDERHTDDKEFDVYISYARNSEEEQFVLSTLRSVLENDLGYSVCIFDRDSLPGGNLSDCVLRSMQRSRRLLFVLSPEFLAEKSFSLFECRLGLYLEHAQKTNIVTVGYRSVSKLPCVEVAQIRKAATTMVTWRGKRSESPRSRFWLRLRLALPVRPLALGRRLIDSTSSHSDLAAFVLQKHYRETANQGKVHRKSLTNQSRGSRRTSANQSLRRERQGVITETRRRSSGWVEVETEQEVRPGAVNQSGPALLTDQTNQGVCPADPSPLPDSNETEQPQQEVRSYKQTSPAHLIDPTNQRSCDPIIDESHDQSEVKTNVQQTEPTVLSDQANQVCTGSPDPAPLPNSTETDQAIRDSTPFTSDSAHSSDPTLSSESPCAIIIDLTHCSNSKDLDPTLSSDSAPFTDSAHSECQQEATATLLTNTAA